MSNQSIRARASRHLKVAVQFALGLGAVGAGLLPAMSANASEEEQIAEIIVTAQFRAQNLQDTPLAITAVSADVLESRSQTNIAEVANQAPNVTLKPQGAAFGPSIAATIRGIGQYDFNPALEPGVGIYVDDVYYATLTGSVLDLLDLDHVEILRGPQGTLAGKNSIGGAVKLFSQKPKGDDSGSLAATYGSRRRIDMRGSADFAISDSLFARISAVSKKQDGYVDRVDYGCASPGNSYGISSLRASTASCIVDRDGNVNYGGVRAALRWVASDNIEVNLSGDYSSLNQNPAAEVLLNYRDQGIPGSGSATNAALDGNFARSQPVYDTNPANNARGITFVPAWGSYYNFASFYGAPTPAFTEVGGPTPTPASVPAMVESRAVPGQTFDGGGAAMTVDWKLGDATSIKSITAYRQYDSSFTNDNDLSPLSASLGDGNLPFHSFSQELRLNGGFASGMFEYTVGGYYMRQSSRYQSWQDLRYSNPLLQFQQDDVVNAHTDAAFAQLGYNVTDALKLTTGVRYTKEHKDYHFVRLNRDGSAPAAVVGVLNGITSEYDGNKTDYRIAAQYRFNDAVMTYAEYSTGFKGGGISPRPFFANQALPFNPETLSSIELGAKMDFFGRTLRINPAIFQSKYKDIQLALQVCPTVPAAPCGVWANAGDATIKGAELEAEWYPVNGLQFDASFSKLKFQWDSLTAAVGSAIQLSYIAPYMPESKWSVGMQYQMDFGDVGTLTPRVDASNQGSMYANGNNHPSVLDPNSNFIESYTLVNARLTWKSAKADWETALEVTNLANKYYLVTRYDNYASSAAYTVGQPGRPREVALTVKRKFK